MKKAIGYIRVSTEGQAKEGVSLESQKIKVRAYAVCKDLELVEIIEDAGKSAKDLKREGIQRVLSLVKEKEIDAVIIYKLDRITRSVKDLGAILDTFTKSEVDLMSVHDNLDTSTASGRLVLNIMASVSQWEREAIGERTSEALQHKKATGFVYGEIPYGYKRRGKRLIKDRKEQENIKLIQSLREKGFSYRAIARELEKDGILTKKGKTRWNQKTIISILKQASQ